VPLKAVVEGETIIGPDLLKEEWADLMLRHKKGLTVRMGCCGAAGHLRVSKKGTQHFYHAADSVCHYEQESWEHLEIKYLVYRICQAENWETYVEFPSPDRNWISDVYATRDGRRVVFEIQISPISLHDLEERDRKYRAKGIESYWLLDNFLGRSRDFASWCNSHRFKEADRPEKPVPYIDPLLFETGPENHIFIAKGIRSVGLRRKNQTLFSTNNKEIPLAVWVKEALKGNYRNYLEETAAVYNGKHRLVILAAPALIRFEDFYEKIVRQKTYREKAGHYHHRCKTDTALINDTALQKKFQDLFAEIDWLENEYRSYTADSYGLFTWKKSAGCDTPRPFFRPESEAKIKKLQECVKMFSRWEEAFERALSGLGREIHR